MWRAALIIILACSGFRLAMAQGEVTTDVPQTTSSKPFFKADGVQVLLYGGSFDTEGEPQLKGVGNSYSLGAGLTADLHRLSHVALDLELHLIHREFDTPVAAPFLGTIDNDTNIDTSALLFGGRLFYPLNDEVRLYASAGLGYYLTTMHVNGSLFGIPGEYTEDDHSLQPYYGAGIRYRSENWSVGVDYRHFELDGSFNDFGISDASLGGDAYLLGFGWRLN